MRLPRSPLEESGVRFGVRYGLSSMSRPVSDAQQSLRGNIRHTPSAMLKAMKGGNAQDCSQSAPFRKRLHNNIM